VIACNWLRRSGVQILGLASSCDTNLFSPTLSHFVACISSLNHYRHRRVTLFRLPLTYHAASTIPQMTTLYVGDLVAHGLPSSTLESGQQKRPQPPLHTFPNFDSCHPVASPMSTSSGGNCESTLRLSLQMHPTNSLCS
jgi:hypothetical protein